MQAELYSGASGCPESVPVGISKPSSIQKEVKHRPAATVTGCQRSQAMEQSNTYSQDSEEGPDSDNLDS